jgi:DNA-binding transcriptional MerR regulator
MTAAGPAHAFMSIGEVLGQLRGEFPDVTISKIRFLESQGLIQPERTPSGYRKFFDGDIERLRWVLRQQKERFLPLKVIKERLDSGEALSDADESPAQPSLFGGDLADPVAAPAPASAASPTPTQTAASPAPVAPSPAPDAAPSPSRAADSAGSAANSDPAAWLAALQEAAAPEPVRRRPPSRPVERPLALDDEADPTRFNSVELAEAAEVTEGQLAQLVEFGIVRAVVMGGEQTYDDAALGAARAASVFMARGIEARHLRAYKLAAEREVGLFEQLILPMLRQRNPAARAQAAETLAELGDAGAELRRALLRQALRASLQRP